MLKHFRQWVDSHIPAAKTRDEFSNAITWMEDHQADLPPEWLTHAEHPGLVFSHVIDSLVGDLERRPEVRKLLIGWLLLNQKTPFGLILKNRVLKALKKRRKMLDAADITDLQALYIRYLQMPHRPGEMQWLIKLLAKAGTKPLGPTSSSSSAT